jgi:hypothetical protein
VGYVRGEAKEPFQSSSWRVPVRIIVSGNYANLQVFYATLGIGMSAAC